MANSSHYGVPDTALQSRHPAAVESLSHRLLVRLLEQMLPLLALVLLWHAAVRLFGIPPFLLPSPLAVLKKMWALRYEFLPHLLTTLAEITGGFLLGVVVAALLALLILASSRIEKLISPVLVASQVVPKIAIAPLLIVWFGYGIAPKVVTAALIAFFPLLVGTVQGLRSVDPLLLDYMASISATPRQTLLLLRLPSAIPFLFEP
jgi:NitT/TauT family transport system permease protein